MRQREGTFDNLVHVNGGYYPGPPTTQTLVKPQEKSITS